MKQPFRFFCLLLSGLLCSVPPAFALTATPGETFTLTVVNHSNHTLSFKKTAHTNPGNHFTLTSNEILPGASITIRATSTHWSGIAGDLTFEDGEGHRNVLQIRDPLQIRATQHPGIFEMSNPRLVSFVPSRTLNTDTHPMSLTWTHATVEIQNRLALA